MDFRYIVLVITGIIATFLGFYALGSGKLNSIAAGLIFLGGIVSLVLGILLVAVPDFFS